MPCRRPRRARKAPAPPRRRAAPPSSRETEALIKRKLGSTAAPITSRCSACRGRAVGRRDPQRVLHARAQAAPRSAVRARHRRRDPRARSGCSRRSTPRSPCSTIRRSRDEYSRCSRAVARRRCAPRRSQAEELAMARDARRGGVPARRDGAAPRSAPAARSPRSARRSSCSRARPSTRRCSRGRSSPPRPTRTPSPPTTRKALQRPPTPATRSPTARFYLGRVERMLGRERRRSQHFQEVLAIKPNHTEAASEAACSSSGSRQAVNVIVGERHRRARQRSSSPARQRHRRLLLPRLVERAGTASRASFGRLPLAVAARSRNAHRHGRPAAPLPHPAGELLADLLAVRPRGRTGPRRDRRRSSGSQLELGDLARVAGPTWARTRAVASVMVPPCSIAARSSSPISNRNADRARTSASVELDHLEHVVGLCRRRAAAPAPCRSEVSRGLPLSQLADRAGVTCRTADAQAGREAEQDATVHRT